MVGRGLQLFAVLVLLGAAPCFSQSTAFPTYVVLQGFTNVDLNGYYVPVGTVGTNGATRLQRFEDDGQAPRYWITVDRRGGNDASATQLRSLFIHASTNYTVWLYFNQINSAFFPTSWPTNSWYSSSGSSISAPGSAINGFGIVPDEYQQAFPDWASASVKIPLGFTFGLALWASVLAFHVPMQWVRQLSQSAT